MSDNTPQEPKLELCALEPEDVRDMVEGVSLKEYAEAQAEATENLMNGRPSYKAKERKTIGYARTEDGLYYGIPGVAERVEPGFYEPVAIQSGPALKRLRTSTDGLIDLGDETSAMLIEEFKLFWTRRENLRKRGLSAKRGQLLYGPPGSGKTCIVNRVCKHMIDTIGGIVVNVNQAHITAGSLQLLRSIEPERPVVLLYEDIDAMLEKKGEEAALLSLIDGELQIGDVYHVATTNYPEKLDKRFTDRPGRFDRITRVPPPTATCRVAYFKARAPEIADARINKWVAASDGWSIAHLREMVMATLELGEEDDAVIARLTEMKSKVWENEDGGGGLGFGRR